VSAVAAALLTFTTGPSPAQTPASRVAGQATEQISRERAVLSTAHYQASLTLTCTGQSCYGDFPALGGRRRLNLTRITCQLHSAQYAAYASGLIQLRTAGNVLSLAQFLPADYSTDWGFHLINSAADVQVPGGHAVNVLLSLAPGGGNALSAACTAHGTLDTLQ
jgi:hypothetical protein